jgi:outer membrane protein assembly factor BamB
VAIFTVLAVTAAPASAAAARASTAGANTVKAGTPRSAGQAPTATDWPAYLDGPRHASYNASQTVITPTTAKALTRRWQFTTGTPYEASPTVVGGRVYVGSENGWFYKLSMDTGEVLAKVFLGTQPKRTCSAAGITSTATLALNPASKVLTVYVAGGDGYLYALRASNLHPEWRSVIGIPSRKVNNYYDWSSPTVARSRVYVGISSNCDDPLVRGGVLAFDEGTGKKLGQFFTVPAGSRNAGGSVWSSIGVAPNGDVYATTGNGPKRNQLLQNSDSILKLSPVRLRLLGSFKVPRQQLIADGDFGGSPVFFGGYVGACNKNGVFYALSQATMKLVWSEQIASASGARAVCLAAPAYNGTDLFFGGSKITINGTAYSGSVQERVASTGTMVWATGLTGAVLGSPTLDAGGVLAAATYAGPAPGVLLIDASDGTVIEQLTSGWTFGQSVFASDMLFTATSNGVAAWGLPAS